MNKPTCYVLIGNIGAGKTTFAKAFSAFTGYPALHGDEMRDRMGGFERCQGRNFKAMYRIADRHLRSGRSIILDATGMSKVYRNAVMLLDAQHHVEVIELYCDEVTWQRREADRKRNLGFEWYKRSVNPCFLLPSTYYSNTTHRSQADVFWDLYDTMAKTSNKALGRSKWDLAIPDTLE